MHFHGTDVQEEMTLPPEALRPRSRPLQPRSLALSRPDKLLSPLLFLLGCVILVHVLVFLSDNLAPDGNTRFLQVDRMHTSQILQSAAKIDALALGNSHTGSLDMKALGFENGYRFPRADGDLFETRYYLEQLIPRMPQVDIVLIPISYFSFLGDNRMSAEVEIRRAHMYASLPSWDALPGDFSNYLIGKSHTFFPVTRLLRPDNWEGVLYALLGSPPEEQGFIEVAAGDCTYMDAETMNASVKNRVAKYMRLTEEMSARHPDLASDTYNTVARIHQFLQSRGVRAVFFTPPYLKTYTDYYREQDPETVTLMRHSMEQLQAEYGVEYYDFSQDETFSLDITQFKDSDHLNACGASAFSKRFRSALGTGDLAGK